MSLADEIEAQLNTIMDKLAEGLTVQPGPERGLAWGENGQGRIVIPMHIVAKVAAGVAREHSVKEALERNDESRNRLRNG